jgi:hypothetical protein
VLLPEVSLREAVPIVIPAVQPGLLMAPRPARVEAARLGVPAAEQRQAHPSAAVARTVRVPWPAEASVVQPLVAEPMREPPPAEGPVA